MAPDGLQALDKKDGRETDATDLVLDVQLIVLNADGTELFGQIGIAQVLLPLSRQRATPESRKGSWCHSDSDACVPAQLCRLSSESAKADRP
jgi:hypothetical protein